MSEKIPSPEHQVSNKSAHYEHISSSEAHSAKKELAAAHHEKIKQRQLEQARSTIETQAEVSRPDLDLLTESGQDKTHDYISPELRSVTARRALQRVRKNMSTLDRLSSRAMHTRSVNALSNIGARTVARPFPLLLGGLFAFIGTTSYLLFARHIGIEYNYFVWSLLFVAGFSIGLAVDALRTLVQRRK
jgi:hypothetical protein